MNFEQWQMGCMEARDAVERRAQEIGADGGGLEPIHAVAHIMTLQVAKAPASRGH